MQHGSIGSAEDEAAFAAAHRDLLGNDAIQFDLALYAPPAPPWWLEWIGGALSAISPLLHILFWAGLALGAALLLFMIVRSQAGTRWPGAQQPTAAQEDDAWRPEEASARQLLAEADALAAQLRFSEAAHLLLFKSIEEIDRRRPQVVRPALTSRDIAADTRIPAAPRSAFSDIVRMVERSLFGRRALDGQDWWACRAAYQQFAFADGWRG